MAKILVTGGAGFIGSFIVRELIKMDHEPIIFDTFAQYTDPTEHGYRETRSERLNDIQDLVILERGNASNTQIIINQLLNYKPDYIIHLAALPLAGIQNETYQELSEGCIQATANLFEAACFLKEIAGHIVKRILYTSSSMVYGNFKSDTASEEDPAEPIEKYGTAKLAGEITTKGLSKMTGIPYTIIRPSAVYGPTDMNQRVTQIFIKNALDGKPLVVKGGNEEKLDFSYVKDVAKGFCMAIFQQEGENNTFNLTSGNAKSLLEYANIVKSMIPGTKMQIKKRDKSKPKRGTLDISKAKQLLGFKPAYSLEAGIKETIDYWKGGKKWLEECK